MEHTVSFGTSGIRGRVGEAVTADLALALGRALSTEADRVVVGRDPRDSGAFLADALAAGLVECGTDVVDLGPAATPTVARSVGWRDADAGVSVTASHNPPEYNGLKLWQPSGQAFDDERERRVEAQLAADDAPLAAWDGAGERTRWDGARAWHAAAIADAVSVPDPPRVVVDLGNGAGGVSVDALRAVGCEVETLNAQPDGAFPGRPSEPTAENCASLCSLVAAGEADLGVAHDGDADRMQAVTAEGEFVPGDVLLAVFTAADAGAGDTVVAPVDTSLLVEDAVEAAGASLERTRVGDVFVAERAAETGAAFGGEPSGAWIFPDETLCPDGPLAAAKLVALVAREAPLAELAGRFERYPIRRTAVEVSEKEAVMDRVREAARARYDDVDERDGVRVDAGDAWFLVRASGTEPKIRLTAEAREEARADEVFEAAAALLDEAR